MEQLQIRPAAVPATLVGLTGDHIFRQYGNPRQFKKHELIYSPGDECDNFYRVGAGEVKLSRYNSEGRELTLDHLGPGTVFGETEILLETPRESQAVARTDVLACQLGRQVLLELIQHDPSFGAWLTRMMGKRQARLENRMESLLFKSASGKVAQVLLKLAEDYGLKTQEGILIDYPITHQEIGNLIATTRETVSYAFMEFRQRGLITTHARKTVVHDMDELVALATA